MNKKLSKILISVLLLIFILPIFSSCTSTSLVTKLSNNKNEYEIKVDIDCENKAAMVYQKTKYINRTSDVALDNVYFHIFPKAFSEGVINKPVSSLNTKKAYPNGESYGEVDINKVYVNGVDAETEYLNVDKDILVVNLNEKLLPNKSVYVEFQYYLKLPNILHRYGYGNNTINLGNFYLIACVYDKNEGFYSNSYHYNGDPFYSDMANYSVEVSYDKNYVLATTGYKISELLQDDKKIDTIKAEGVRDFALILSDKFKVISEHYNDTIVNYYYFDDKNPEKSLKASVDSLKTFSELYREYPYKTLSVCESDFVYGGMEYPNLVFISTTQENYDDYIYTIVHEIAHQWWYNMVGNNEYKYGFLDEGLTEYSTYLFYEQNLEYNMDTREMIKNTTNSYLLFIDVYEEVFGKVDTSMLRSLNEYNTEPEYIYMVYVKGVLMYDNLREIIGHNKFIKALKYYFNQNVGENATPEDLIYAFNKTCGRDFESYFNNWFNGNVVIESL
ncbi:MAG: M1 family metallopeptidase [Clostridiales bacterium]|nr:M1 family metallopeptidase [Clostridiales bacterium]